MIPHNVPSGDGKFGSSRFRLTEQFDFTGVNPVGSSSPRQAGFPPYSPMIRSLATVVPSTLDRSFGLSVVALYLPLSGNHMSQVSRPPPVLVPASTTPVPTTRCGARLTPSVETMPVTWPWAYVPSSSVPPVDQAICGPGRVALPGLTIALSPDASRVCAPAEETSHTMAFSVVDVSTRNPSSTRQARRTVPRPASVTIVPLAVWIWPPSNTSTGRTEPAV